MVIEIGRASSLTRGGPRPSSVTTWPLRVYVDFRDASYLPRLLHADQDSVADSLDASGPTWWRGSSCARVESNAAARLRQRD